MNDRAKFSLSDIRRRPAALIEAVRRGPVEVTRRGREVFVFEGGRETVRSSESTESRRRQAAAEILRHIPKARATSVVTLLLEEARFGHLGGHPVRSRR